MKTLRNQLDRATHAYQATSYPGNLALDVLGPAVTVKRRNFAPLAIAAALAMGLIAGIVADRMLQTSPVISNPVAVKLPTPPIELPPVTPKLPKTAVATNDQTDTPAANGAFTVVPTGESFTGQSVSVVPDLGSLDEEASTTSASKTPKAAVAFVPMSLMLLSASEYGEQETAAAAAKTKTNSSNPSSASEERS